MSTQQAIDVEATATPHQAVAVREQPGAVGPALAPADIKAPMTPAQGKVDAIASLTMAAYQKAATLVITKEESDQLRADFPDEAFKPGAGGKEHLIYIEHAYLRDRFTQVFGMGQWALIPRNRWAEPFKTQKGVEGSRVYVEAMLVVRGCFVGEAIGEMEYYPSNGSQNYGDATEGAKTAAFRRCAKEFGVGLQAWKKDFGDGWWARKRGQPRQAPSGGTGIPPASQRTTSPAVAPAAPAPQAPRPLPFPTAEGRAKMIEQLKAAPGAPNRDIVTEFFRKAAHGATFPLMPGEELEALELRWVPVMASQMRDLSERIASFANGDQAAWPYPPNAEAPPPKAAKASAAPAKPMEVPRDGYMSDPADPNDPDLWFLKIVVPIPRKGQRRDDYLKSPDTIGSLYEARHGKDDLAQEARQRLWGFVNYFEPKPWTGKDGQERPPSKTDVQFREALDAFKEYFTKNHPGEKL